MNTLTKYILVFLFAIPAILPELSLSYAQPLNTFMRTFQATGMNGGLSLAQTSDEGFIGTGQHESSGAGSCDVYVYKVDGCGNPEWFRTYGGPGEDGGKDIHQTADGGYIVAGLAHLGVGNYDMLLMKLDALGNIEWSKVYGGPNADFGLYVQQTADGGYIMSGFMTGLSFGNEDVTLIKTDANGNTQWIKVFGGVGSDWGDYVEQTSDGGYKVVGYTTGFGAGSYDIYVLKVDASGNLLWTKTYGGAGLEASSQWGISGKVTSDGGFMICANTDSYGAGGNDYLLIKTNDTGSVQWAKTYGGTAEEQPRFALETMDRGFAIFGYTTSFGAGDLDAYLVKTDSVGILQWSKAYGGPAYDKGSMAREAPDGGFALSIVTASFGANYFDPLFMKTDSVGDVGCNEVNAATLVQNVTPTVGSGGTEAIPACITTIPAIVTNTFVPNDVYLCQHCNTVPSFVPSDTIICVGDTIELYNTTTIGKRCFEGWYINNVLIPGDIDTLKFVFDTAGTQKIQLIAKCGNTSTDTNTIFVQVFDYPVAAYTNTSVCEGNTTAFTDASSIPSGSINSWAWNFGDSTPLNNTASPSHLYSPAGSYQATLKVSNSAGCADSITKTVSVYHNPATAFTFNNVCLGDSVHFTNTSSIHNSTSISSYSWNFGDGSPLSNAANPAHYYATHGIYTVTLIATSANACSDTTTAIVSVFDLPVSSFSFSNVCRLTSASFINASSQPTMGSIAGWKWTFGDGTSPDTTNNNPNHLYTAPGNYTVTLINYSSNLGCADTLKDTISVFPMPIANFGLTDVCLYDSVNLFDSSTVSAGSITTRVWNFGDNSPVSNLQNPSHKYTAAGTYTITLIATTNNGCKDTISKTVLVHALPAAQFTTAANICHGKYAFFMQGSSIPNTDTIQSWQWNFDDGSPLLNQQTVAGGHLFTATGTYNVQQIVISTFGCSDTILKPITVRPKPLANFGHTKVCDGTNTLFSDSSITASGTVNAWTWNFADGSPANLTQNPTHLFNNAGIHAVTLTIQNNFGCADTVTMPVTVYYNPVTNFTVQDVCLNDSVFFTDSSYVNTSNSASVTTYLWVFGDGSPTANSKNSAHLYTNDGTYSVTLLSTTNQNCSDATTKQVHVYDPPVANFTVNDVCLFDSVIFVNTSSNPSTGTISNVLWSFGDGTLLNNTALNPHHLYTATGTYPVRLITYSSNLACADTLMDSVTVFPIPVAAFATEDVCLGLPSSFTDSSTVSNNNTITFWNWNFGDGSAASILQNPPHTYTIFGEYTATLIVTTNNGCKDTVSNTTIVHPLPAADFTTNNICLGDSTIFTDLSVIAANNTNDLITQWIWEFGDNSALITTQNATHEYNAMGSYTVELKAVSGFGCIDLINKTVVVNPNPQVAFSANDSVGCEPLCVNFSDASTLSPGANVAWTWILGDNDTITNTSEFNHCYTNDSVFAINQYTVTLIVTSDSGCVSSLAKNNYIDVYPAPIASFNISPTSATITDPVVTITNLTTGATAWAWNFGDSDTSSLQHPQPHTYADTGSYLIRLIANAQYNCADTSYQSIVIEPDFMLYIPSAFSPNDDGVNDTFIPKGMFINEFEMVLFDRWGNLIFTSNALNKPWDGKANNGSEPAQPDVYIYSIKVVDFRSVIHQYKGTVTIVK